MNATRLGLAIFLGLGFLAVGLFGFKAEKPTLDMSDFLRVHIRANSNSEIDQTLKYEVKNKVVETLTPLLANAETKAQAIEIVGRNIPLIESVSSKVLEENKFFYGATAEVKQEYFPTRSYDGHVLEAGEYDALILNLGQGKGDNWWCVVYPPLCFVGGENNGATGLTYKSKLQEIINNFFK